jgi:2-dehydropantoate 2-reductase
MSPHVPAPGAARQQAPLQPGTRPNRHRVAVYGAGAVGCYYGAMLARAGHPVTLIGRPAHVEAMNRGGLRLEARGADERIAVSASADPAAVAGATLVLVCVKSGDSDAAAEQMRPHLDPGAVVMSLQNGVDNADRLQAALDRPVLPVVVYVATEMAGPGHVRHHGRGELAFGGGGPGAGLAALFEAAGVPVLLSDNVRGMLWSKLILNCAYNALSAIARQPYGPLAQAEGVQAVMRDVVDECLAVARADGVVPADEPWAQVERIAQTMPTQFSSTAQDLMRGKPSEIDHLNGYVIRRGAALGVATPVNRVLHTLVKLLDGAVRTERGGQA